MLSCTVVNGAGLIDMEAAEIATVLGAADPATQHAILVEMLQRLNQSIQSGWNYPIVPTNVSQPTLGEFYSIPDGEKRYYVRWPNSEYTRWVSAWNHFVTALNLFGASAKFPLGDGIGIVSIISTRSGALLNDEPKPSDAIGSLTTLLGAVEKKYGFAKVTKSSEGKKNTFWSIVGLVAAVAVGGGLVLYIRRVKGKNVRPATRAA